MIKKYLTVLTTALMLFSAIGQARAQNTNADAQGYNTGAASDAADASNTAILLSAPNELSADDKKDTNKVAAFNTAQKAYNDQQAQMKTEPLAVRMLDATGHNRVAINFMWTLITGFLVMFMQAGFALVETGLCRAKNAGHTMSMNFMIYPMGMLGFYLCGFAFMFGGMNSPLTPNPGAI